MRDRHVYGLAAALTVIGVGYFLYKWLVLGLPLSFHAKTDLWEVETALTFEAKGEPVRLAFQIPKDDVNFSIVNQSFVSRGYGISTEEGAAGNRRAVLAIRRAEGRQAVYYGFVILRARSGVAEIVDEEPVVVPPHFTDRNGSPPKPSCSRRCGSRRTRRPSSCRCSDTSTTPGRCAP